MMKSNVLHIVLVLLICVKFSRNASLSLHEQKKYKGLIEGQGLYGGDDEVEVLTNSNFKNRIYGQSSAWVVEFYNSWCGFCQRFAPSWKALAKDIKKWQGVLNVGAIDCADDDNSDICRNFEIIAYPTLRYFHENYVEGAKNIGANLSKGSDMEEHKNILLKFMITEQENKRGLNFPSLLPYNHPNLLHLFDSSNVNAKYVFLIIDLPDSTLGPQLSLDFHEFKKIGIRYATKENSKLIKSVNAKKFPFMMVLSDQNDSHVFSENLHTREAFTSAIIEYVKPDFVIEETRVKLEAGTGKWIDEPVPDIGSIMEAKAKKELLDKIKKMGDATFQADLETALRYSLKTEVGNVKSISDERLKALQDFLHILVKYFPFGVNGQVFLMELLDSTKERTLVNGADIVKIVDKYEDSSKLVFSSPNQWIACQSSIPGKRGYPCGLWKLFHYLSVQASERNGRPKEVLQAMHGYVKYFFGCADCSKHFQEMANRKDLEGVASLNSAVLWLWMAHNEVNRRIGGDATEDPEFPKMQFPSNDHCPKCRNDDSSWNYNEVLKYLKNVYSSVNIRYIGADSSILHPGVHSQKGNASIYEQIDAKGVSEKDVRT